MYLERLVCFTHQT